MFLGTNLSYLRKRKGLSRKDIGELLGVSYQTIGYYECGNREPNLKNLQILARLFEVTVDDLIGKDLQPTRSMLANNLKYLRKTSGYTQTDMARLLGYKGKSSLSLIESEDTELSIERLLNISNFFGVTVDDLLKKDLSKGGIEGDNAGEKDCE